MLPLVAAGPVLIFFLGMGLVALAAPETISRTFGTIKLTPDGRNEVRAVYGGFGLAVAAMLACGLYNPGVRDGIFLTVAGSLAGMAAGRFVAAAIEPPSTFYPSWLYCGVELTMAGMLWFAS